MRDLTTFNFESVDNGRIASKDNGNKLLNIADSIRSIKLNIPAKIANRCSASSILSGAASSVESCKTSCDNVSNLYEKMISLYKDIDYSTSEEIMKAFSQSLLLFELGFITLDNLKNLYEKKLYTYDEKGKYVEVTYDMLLNMKGKFPISARPLGGGNKVSGYTVLDPVTGLHIKSNGNFAWRFQGVINVLSNLGIHVPIVGGINQNHNNPGSLHRKGFAADYGTGNSININYNNGSDIVTIRQNKTAVSESAYNVFYNTIDCTPEEMIYNKNISSGCYAKIPEGTIVPEQYEKYIVNNLTNVVQSNDVTVSSPSASNLSLVSIEGTFVDMDKLYADAGLQRVPPIVDWPKSWNDYEAHHVELIMNETEFPRLFDSTGTLLNDVEAEQCSEILDVLHNLS